jgi:transposase
MSRKGRRNFPPEFRLEAAQLVVDQHYSVREAAQAMGVGISTMDKWVRQVVEERSGKTPAGRAITAEQQEIQQLKKRIRDLEEDKLILKKASALLMSDSMRGLR